MHFKPETVTRLDIILFDGQVMHNLQEKYTCHALDPPVIIPEGELVCPAKFMTPIRKIPIDIMSQMKQYLSW